MQIESTLQILLSEHVTKAAYIIDAEGRIISYNNAGENYLPEVSENGNLLNIMEEEVAVIVKEIIKESSVKEQPVKKDLNINATGVGDKYQLFCLPIKTEAQNLFIVTIGKVQESISRDGNKKFIFYTSEIETFIKDELILKIIGSIKSSYPFTFIGKTKFQKEIDELDVAFWIKDQNGKFSIVNQRYANSLGLRVSQIEGQYEKDLVPRYMLKLNRTIDNYIMETSNSVVVERENPGSLRGKKEIIEVIEFPICDIDNNVVAIVGFSRTKLGESGSSFESPDLLIQTIENIDEICLVLDKNDNIHAASRKLIEKYKLGDSKNIVNKKFEDIFGSELDNYLSELKKNTSSKETTIENIKLDLVDKKEEISVKINLLDSGTDENTGAVVIFKPKNQKITKDFSDKMYEAMMQNSPEAMFIYDIENLRFLEVNNAALKLYGYSREQFLNMDLTDLYAPEDIQTLLDSSNNRAMSGDFTGPWRHKKQNGESILVELSKTTLEFKGRNTHLNLVRDVGERLEQNKKIQLFKASFENSSNIIINTDVDGFITFMNEQAVKILGFSKKDLEGNSLISIVGDEYRAGISTNIFHAGTKDTVKREIEIKKNSGDLINASLVATPIINYDGEIDSYNILLKTEEKKQETYDEDKGDEIPEKEGVLEASFLSNVFHEILTPINVIVGFVRELTESIEKPTEEQEEATQIINENQKMLLQLMDNAVEYSSLVQGKSVFKPEEILFTDLIDELKSSVKKTGEEFNVEFAYGKISSSLKFESDRQKILSLLILFLKFTIQLTKKQKVFLSAYLFDEDRCVISVKDDRKTISKELLTGLKEVLNLDENELRRKYGFSRFIVKLTQKMLEVLKIKNEILMKGGEPVEFGLVVPLRFEVEEGEKLQLESSFIDEAFGDKEDEKIFHEEEINTDEMDDEEIEQKIEQLIEEKHPKVQYADVVEEHKTIVEEVKHVEPIKTPEEVTTNKSVVQDNSSINVNVNLQQAEVYKKENQSEHEEVTPVRKGVNLPELSCLYVEDQVDSQILFKVQMKDMKSVEFATSFEKAVPFLKSRTFDFIVMDINLQGEYNGLDALRIIQKMPGYEHIPIIAVTAYVLPGDREKFIAAGFKDFISKPILREKLIDVLKSIF